MDQMNAEKADDVIADLEAKHGLSPASGSTDDGDIRCTNCFKLFDVMKAEVGARTLPNTLTGLEDINNPWIKCPYCGCIM